MYGEFRGKPSATSRTQSCQTHSATMMLFDLRLIAVVALLTLAYSRTLSDSAEDLTGTPEYSGRVLPVVARNVAAIANDGYLQLQSPKKRSYVASLPREQRADDVIYRIYGRFHGPLAVVRWWVDSTAAPATEVPIPKIHAMRSATRLGAAMAEKRLITSTSGGRHPGEVKDPTQGMEKKPVVDSVRLTDLVI
ncbi:hypothetical protein LSAT2_009692 [Lamellibrachia satsuma]|nr:hypothetical protein LSAT2_009692 [Lamellibrachia satsuma]